LTESCFFGRNLINIENHQGGPEIGRYFWRWRVE